MVLVSLIGVAGLQFTFTDRLDLLILGALTGTVMLYDRLIVAAFSGIRPPDQRRTAGDRP